MRRPWRNPAGHGAGSRTLSLLLACLFASGFLPAAGPGCDCTAEHNCGCTCWLGRGTPEPGASASEPKPSCCAREVRDGQDPATACAARTLSEDASPAQTGGSSASHERWLLDWELTEKPAQPRRDATPGSLAAAPIAHDSFQLEPRTPPPRFTPAA